MAYIPPSIVKCHKLNKAIAEALYRSLKETNLDVLKKVLDSLKPSISEILNCKLPSEQISLKQTTALLGKLLIISELFIAHSECILPSEPELLGLLTRFTGILEDKTLSELSEDFRVYYTKVLNDKFLYDCELKALTEAAILKSRCHRSIEAQFNFMKVVTTKYKINDFTLSSFWEILYNIANSTDPELPSAIKYVVVLAGRGSFLKRQIDFPTKAGNEIDAWDRLHLGINSALEITAKQLNKTLDQLTQSDIIQFGPTPIYNGRPGHNMDLVLSQVMPKSARSFPYPVQKIKILDLKPDQYHTKGQFDCLKKLKMNADTLFVTSAYHAPRVFHLLGKGSPANPLGKNAHVFARLVNRQFLDLLETTDVANDIMGENDRVPKYIGFGHLAERPCKTVVFTKPQNLEGSGNPGDTGVKQKSLKPLKPLKPLKSLKSLETKSHHEISKLCQLETRKIFLQYEILKKKSPSRSYDDMDIHHAKKVLSKKPQEIFIRAKKRHGM